MGSPIEVLGLIPARLGSTGVKRKNIRPLAGRPLIEYSIEAALTSRLDRVILSTEADEIADVGRAAGVEIPFTRPMELAKTQSKAIEVITHALNFFEQEEGWCPDAVFYLQPTSPFRTTAIINDALNLIDGSESNSVISVTSPESHPAYMFVANQDGSLSDLLDPAIYRSERRQDLKPVFSFNCTTTLTRTDFLQAAAAHGGMAIDFTSFEAQQVQAPANIDINTEQDFLFADFLMRRHLGLES